MMPSRLLFPLLALCALLTACAPRQDDRVVLKFWAMGREGEVVSQLMPEFERTHPHIRVEVQQLPWTAAHQKMLTAFAGEVMPDVFQLGNTWVPEFHALKAIRQLDGYVARSQVVQRGDYFGGIWDTNVIDGKLYGLPWYVDTRVMFYNRALLAELGYREPPRTWAAWMKVMRAVKQKVGPQNYAILLPNEEYETLLGLALQQDEPLLRDGGRYGNFRSASFRRALTLYRDMFAQKLAPIERVSNLYHEFSMRYISFYFSGPWNIGEFRRRVAPAAQQAWMTARLPGPDGYAPAIAGGSSLAIASSSRHPDEAWQLVEYLSRTDVADRFNELTGDMPPRRSNWEVPRLGGDPYARAFREQLEYAKPVPKVPEWENIVSAMRVMGERVAHGTISVDDAVVELDAEVDRILEKRRWMLDREARR